MKRFKISRRNFLKGSAFITGSAAGAGLFVSGNPELHATGSSGTSKVKRSTALAQCPYCGVGCLLTYHVKDDKILRVEGRDGPANFSRLCVKGRYGFDYVNHPQRLLKPLIRREGVPKGLNQHFDPSDPSKMFREASWMRRWHWQAVD